MKKLLNKILGRKTWRERQLEKADSLKAQHKASGHIYACLSHRRADEVSKQIDGRSLMDRVREKLEKRGIVQ